MDTAYDGGGWTLISTHSDDAQDTWTWNNRHYFDTDTTTFGSLSALNEDFKSAALHDVGMEDVLFVLLRLVSGLVTTISMKKS